MAWRIAAMVAMATLACGCRHHPVQRFGVVRKGTEIPLILVQSLESGADAVGTVVPFMATRRITDASGEVVIEKGAVALGKIVPSEGERTGAGSKNHVRRLTITIDDVTAVDGLKVKLSVLKGGLQIAPLDLTKENTRLQGRYATLDRAWDLPDVHKNLVKLLQIVGTSKNSDLGANPATSGLLRALAMELDLAAARRLARGQDTDQVATLAGELATGRSDLAALARAGTLQVGAVIEFIEVIGYAESRLDRTASRRSTKAFVGTPFVAYVVEQASVRLPPTE